MEAYGGVKVKIREFSTIAVDGYEC